MRATASQFAVCVLLTVLAVVAFSPAVADARRAAASDKGSGRLLLLDVAIDGLPAGKWNLLERNGVIFAPAAFFDRFQLVRRSNVAGIAAEGLTWYSLASVPNLEAVHYFEEMLLEVRRGPGKASAPLTASAPAVSTPPPALAPVTIAPPKVTGSTAVHDAPAGARLLPLEVSINGSREGSWLLLEFKGALYAPADAFEQWRVNRRTDEAGLPYRGQTWFKLSSVPGFDAQLNAANQSVDLKFLPGAFASTRVAQAKEEKIPLSVPSTALFANYDLNQTITNNRGVGTARDLGALTELGISGPFGVLTNTNVGRNLMSDSVVAEAGGTSGRNWRRLETTFTRDFPDRNMTLRIGDSTTRNGAWGRANYFGGIQLARNFALTPGFITQPIPTISGQSSAPSTVELYINDALRQTSQVPAGPFSIDNFPLLTGSGQARVVVRDLLGRETVLVQNFFSHSDLLDEGLTDWSLDAGAVRNNLGIANADYGARFGSGLWRYGVNKSLTLETRAEAGHRTRGGGAGLSLALPGQMLGQVAVAVSNDDDAGRGRQWLVGLEHTSLRHGFTLRAEGANREYRQIGVDAAQLGYRAQLSGSYTYSSEQLGYFGLGYARINSLEHGPLTTYSANYSMRLGSRGTVSLSATKVSGQLNADSIGISVLIPLDNQTAVTTSATRRGGQTDAYVSASHSLGVENGMGWRALAGTLAGSSHVESGWYYQASKGSLTADASAFSNQKTVRLGAQGGLVLIDGSMFATRRVQDSFALVEVPGYANVGVGFQSSVLTRTDDSGRALVPRLMSYRQNRIRLDPSELPINAEIDNIEQIVVPGSRVGIKVEFPVRDGRGALIKIVFDDGQPAPPGADLKLAGDDKEFFVARRGEAFVTGLKATNTLVLTWNEKSCRMSIEMPPGKPDEIARIGPITCSGMTR